MSTMEGFASPSVSDLPKVENESDENSKATTDPPQFAVFQKNLAKDNTTPLLYEAVVRKIVYALKSQKINIRLMESSEEGIEDD